MNIIDAVQLTFEGFAEPEETELVHYLKRRIKFLQECLSSGEYYGEHIKAMLESPDKKTRIDGLKDWFGIGGGNYHYADGSEGWYDYNSKGIFFKNEDWSVKYAYTYSQVDDAIQTLWATLNYIAV